MDHTFNSPHLGESTAANAAEASLKEGLAAMKRKDYAAAIAHFETVTRTTTEQGTSLKAQMGLVMAHQRLGNKDTAIALCQELCTSPSRQLREWATQTLGELAQSTPDTSRGAIAPQPHLEPDHTGFVPLTDSQHGLHSSGENTGFVPFEPAPQASPAADGTGFVPFEQPLQSPPSTPLSGPSAQAVHTASDRANAVDLPPVSSNLPPVSSSKLPTAPPSKLHATVQPGAAQPVSIDRQTRINRTVSRSAKATSTVSDRAWRNAGRAQKWAPLGPVDLATLWALEAGTVIALFLAVRELIQVAIATKNWIFNWIRWPIDLRYYIAPYDSTLPVLLGLLALFLVAPWGLDRILQSFYSARPLTLDELAASSPETARMLKRVCSQRRISLPTLRVLPSTAPLALSYGFMPRNAKIAVSRGLLSQLSDDEIAAIFAGELGHIIRWDFVVLSFVVFVTQLPYLLYWTIGGWGDRQRNQVLQALAVGLSSLSYGVFWVLRWMGLWLSRVRLYYSDRMAAEMTGNPNGLTRALLKIAIGTASEIQRHRYTSALLESFDLLTPVGYQTALTVGSVSSHASLEALLQWDTSNPHRHWLSINNSHSPLGDRLHQLALYARHWRLETELDLVTSSKPARISPSPSQTRRFLLQSAPFLGMMFGVAIAICLWTLGSIANQLYWFELSWMQGDPSIFWGCLLTGFSIGTILRINAFFRDITSSTLQVEPHLSDLLAAPSALPIDGQPVQLQGHLLGRQGIRNRLNQDLILQSESGLIKLHHLSQLGPFGNLSTRPTHPTQLINRPVTITGWFRRGATPWIDVDTIQPLNGRSIQSGHPIWSTVLAIAASLLTAYIIILGSGL